MRARARAAHARNTSSPTWRPYPRSAASRHLSKVHLSDAELPEFSAASAKGGAAAGEAAPLISADGTLAGAEPPAAVGAQPVGIFSDMSSSGLIQ